MTADQEQLVIRQLYALSEGDARPHGQDVRMPARLRSAAQVVSATTLRCRVPPAGSYRPAARCQPRRGSCCRSGTRARCRRASPSGGD